MYSKSFILCIIIQSILIGILDAKGAFIHMSQIFRIDNTLLIYIGRFSTACASNCWRYNRPRWFCSIWSINPVQHFFQKSSLWRRYNLIKMDSYSSSLRARICVSILCDRILEFHRNHFFYLYFQK